MDEKFHPGNKAFETWAKDVTNAIAGQSQPKP
jgi:hypothetical protein